MTPTERYLARVQAHLAGLPGDDRRAFLTSEITKWEERYSAWMAKVDRGGDPGSATAFDFTETILALQSLLAQQAKEAA